MKQIKKTSHGGTETRRPDEHRAALWIDKVIMAWRTMKAIKTNKCARSLARATHGIPVDKNGCFDGEELARRMLSFTRSEFSQRWNEYLIGHVERNAARYNMPPEWVEEIRANIYAPKPPPPDDDSGGMQQYLLTVFYELR